MWKKDLVMMYGRWGGGGGDLPSKMVYMVTRGFNGRHDDMILQLCQPCMRTNNPIVQQIR